MRSSVWSSRVISGCSAAAVALALAPAAGAHVTMRPVRIDPGSDARVVFSVPNETKATITQVAIGLPPDFRLGEAEVKPGWKTEMSSRTVTWKGHDIKPDQFAEFTLHVQAPDVEEKAVFPVLVSLANGQTVTYQPSLLVEPAPAPRDEGARTLATAALIVGGAGLLVAIGGGFLAFWLWLRPRPPDVY